MAHALDADYYGVMVPDRPLAAPQAVNLTCQVVCNELRMLYSCRRRVVFGIEDAGYRLSDISCCHTAGCWYGSEGGKELRVEESVGLRTEAERSF